MTLTSLCIMIISVLICQTMICPIFIFGGKSSLKVRMVTPNHVIDGTVSDFLDIRKYSILLEDCVNETFPSSKTVIIQSYY